MTSTTTTVSYEIKELPPHPQIQAGQRYRNPLHRVALAATWALDAYFIVRLGLLITAVQQTWQMWLMIAVEWIFARISRQNQLLTVAAGHTAARPRERLRLNGSESLPKIDVLIPCCGEPLDVILDTVRAACFMDYPNSQFRVLLLDDGGSAPLKDAVHDLQLTHPNLTYHTRGSHPGKVFAKSGNMNYALFSLQESFQPEFCAILDADCIPAPDFLRATLPHLLLNPQAVLLTTRQYYYNLPAGDPLSQSRIHFYACHNADLDVQKCAIDAGSGALFRRQTILDVGGYPTFSFSEDWQLSLILQGHGHQTLQVEEPLQFGLVPTTLQGHIAQRNRWNIGHAQQVKALFPPTGKALPRRLQWDIARNGVGIVLSLCGYLVVFLALPVLFLSDGDVIPASSRVLVSVQILLAVAHIGLMWLYALLQAASTGFRVSLFSHLENSWLAGTQLFAIFKFSCFTSKPKGSFVTGSSANAWNCSVTPSLSSKFIQTISGGAMFGVVLFSLTVGSILFSIWRTLSSTIGVDGDRTSDFVRRLLTTIAWPPLLHLCYLSIVNLSVPVTCLLRPPRYPPRAAQLEENSKRGVRLPRVDVQKEISYQRAPLPAVSLVLLPAVLIAALVGAVVV
ncbi:nucleotide-diphospho-sugar transferase [Aspergillus pseudoustus]|uniref:Nucleotide-diphospho-sugar transferase n=1 Tax=Aspergillus pseudoustus TaxID=1810923 RepID=A0ABR4KIE6_9EURO